MRLTADDTPLAGCPLLLDTYAIDGRTPLITAVGKAALDIVEALLIAGADVNLPLAITDTQVAALVEEEARCVGSGALIEAVSIGRLDLLHLLFAHDGVDYDNQALRWVYTILFELVSCESKLS